MLPTAVECDVTDGRGEEGINVQEGRPSSNHLVRRGGFGAGDVLILLANYGVAEKGRSRADGKECPGHRIIVLGVNRRAGRGGGGRGMLALGGPSVRAWMWHCAQWGGGWVPFAQWPHSLRCHVIDSQVLVFFLHPHPIIIPNQVCRAVLIARTVSLLISRLPHRLGRGRQDKHPF